MNLFVNGTIHSSILRKIRSGILMRNINIKLYMYVCIYIYIYIYRERERERERERVEFKLHRCNFKQCYTTQYFLIGYKF